MVYNVDMQPQSDTEFDGYEPKVAFFFPGQGAQTVGMAKDVVAEVPKAKELFEQASDILGYDLLQVCAEGPKEKLDSTAVSQPAIFVSSLAAIEKLRSEEGDVRPCSHTIHTTRNLCFTIYIYIYISVQIVQDAVNKANVAAGLSLGEYTALTYAGAMSFEDGLKLVELRGQSMQAAADAKPSGMVSVIGLSADKVAELCEAATAEVGADKGVKIANYLCNGNYAVSGGIEGCEAVQKLAKDFKARMTVPLAVAGAFHTEYMEPAAEKLQAALDATSIVKPRIPVVSNVDAMPHTDPETIKKILALQLTSPVQWETTLKTLLDKGLEESFEIGPNKVIAGIMKRIDRKHSVTNITV